MTFWTENDLSAERAKHKKSLIVYALVAIVWLAASVVILVLSKNKNYVPFMIADMVVGTLFGWFSVWFFSNPFHDARKRIALYGVMTVSRTEEEIGKVVSVGEITKDGLPLIGVTLEKNGEERKIYLLPRYLGLIEVGKTYKFTVRYNVATECGVTDE